MSDTAAQDRPPYSIGSLLTNAGTGSNGDKLIDAVMDMYPPELRAAQLKRPDVAATANLMDVMEIEKIVDLHEVHDAVVRGGTARADQAWVTFAGYDETGRTVKGCILLSDLEEGDTDSMVTQTDTLEDAEEEPEEKPLTAAQKKAAKKAAAKAKKEAEEEAERQKAIENADPDAAADAANSGDENPGPDGSDDTPAEADPPPSDEAPAEGDSSPAGGGEADK